jgi:alpha,alpha-trehalase
MKPLFLQACKFHGVTRFKSQTKSMSKSASKYSESLRYIKYYWKKITYYHPKDKQLHLGLPNRYVAPNNEIFKKDMFYWDSYFVILGLVKSGKVKLARGMIDNFVYLFKRFSIVPMRNRYYNLGTSQIPFLTSMAMEVFGADPDKAWLKKVFATAEGELKKYWMNEKLTETHIVYKKLSRYCDHYITHLGAEHESGWDMTSRFHDRCLDYLPVDLNSCLYKYETDLAEGYKLLGNYAKAAKYRRHARARKKTMNALMWNEKHHFYYDYNKLKKHQSTFMSVAGFYPLWARLASKKQAALIREHVLPLFEYEGGITNTQPSHLSADVKQHDHPNGWPHQQWIVITGLLNYGFNEDAERIARKWVDMNLRLFEETGKFWEKYDVVRCAPGVYNPDRYVTQSGFGWTNAIYLRLINDFGFK